LVRKLPVRRPIWPNGSSSGFKRRRGGWPGTVPATAGGTGAATRTGRTGAAAFGRLPGPTTLGFGAPG
jgi:hypothetical protein